MFPVAELFEQLRGVPHLHMLSDVTERVASFVSTRTDFLEELAGHEFYVGDGHRSGAATHGSMPDDKC